MSVSAHDDRFLAVQRWHEAKMSLHGNPVFYDHRKEEEARRHIFSFPTRSLSNETRHKSLTEEEDPQHSHTHTDSGRKKTSWKKSCCRSSSVRKEAAAGGRKEKVLMDAG